MNNITREKESSFCMDILKYINLAIENSDPFNLITKSNNDFGYEI